MEDLLVIDDEEEPLPPEADHLLMLAYRLKGLIKVLTLLKRAAVAHYCRLLVNTMEAMAPLYRQPGLLPRGEIDTDDSGFPHTEDLLYLFEESSAAARGLRNSTSQEQLLEQMRAKIFTGQFPEEEYSALARRHHLEKVRGFEVAEEFKIMHPILQKETEAFRFYKLTWRGWDDRTCLFRFYSTIFTQDRNSRPLEEISRNSPTYEKIRSEFQRPLPQVVESLFFRDGVVPKSVDRYTIGPYYAPGCATNPTVKRLFQDQKHPFILKLSLERLILETPLMRPTLMEDLIAGQGGRPVHLIEQRSRYLLCNPDLKDQLGGVDEKGEPATIFTLDSRGEVQ